MIANVGRAVFGQGIIRDAIDTMSSCSMHAQQNRNRQEAGRQ
jgi:hypothetical protein